MEEVPAADAPRLCVLMLLGLAVALWASSLYVPGNVGSLQRGAVPMLAILGWIAVASPCLAIGLYLGHRLSESSSRWMQALVWVLVAAVVFVVAIASFKAFVRCTETATSPEVRRSVAIFATRAARLTSGVSPLVPAVLLIAAFWMVSVGHLRRLRMLAHCPVGFPFPGASNSTLAGLSERVNDLRKSICAPRMLWWGWPLQVIISALGFLLIFGKPQTIMEEQPFAWFSMLAIPLTFVAVAMMLLHALATWTCLSGLLRRLAWHPLVEICVKLPDAFKQPVASQLLATLPAVEESGALLDYWPRIERLVDAAVQYTSPGLESQQWQTLKTQIAAAREH